jgi:ATP-dependent helicase/nuclease subunit A
MTEDLGGEDYAGNRLQAGRDYYKLFADHRADPVADATPRLHLVALGADADLGSDDDGAGDDGEPLLKQEQVYRRVADVLRAIHDEGQAVYDNAAGVVRRVAWRDMAVLLRSARGRMETLRAVLDDAGIPYYAPARSGFYERPEISDALSLLRVIDNPRQDIALAAALSGPACGLDPAQLLALSRIETAPPGGRLWDKAIACMSSVAAPELRDALARFAAALDRWRRLARLEPLPVLLWDVYTRSGLLAAAAALPGGEQRLANLYQLHELARGFASFERQGLTRFMRYLEHSRRAQGDLGEAPLAGEGQNVVRVMTVHQAKGLEFPVVVIPDVDKEFNQADLRGDVLSHKDAGLGGRFVDMRADPPERGSTLGLRRLKRIKKSDLLSQELRVMYVALTRARERLELVAAVDPQKQQDARRKEPSEANSWLDWVGCSLGDGIGAALSTEDRQWQGEHWDVLARPPEHGAAEVRPPAAVLEAAELAAIEARLTLSYPHHAATLTPAKLTVTELAKQPRLAVDDDQPAFAVGTCAANGAHIPGLNSDAAANSGMARGTALHLLLSAIDPRQSLNESALQAELTLLVERGLVEPQVAAGLDVGRLGAALALLSPHLPQDGMELHRELPFAMLVSADDPALVALAGGNSSSLAADQLYVQGVIDLLAVTADSALVVEYKSDRSAGADELTARYSAQLQWYCRAVRAMHPGRQVSWALLGLDAPVLAGPFEET